MSGRGLAVIGVCATESDTTGGALRRLLVAAALEDRIDLESVGADFEARGKTRSRGWNTSERFWTAYQAEQWTAALAAVDSLVALQDPAFYYEAAMRFDILYRALNEREEARTYARTIAAGSLARSHEGLAAMVRAIREGAKPDEEDLALAVNLAEQARELTLSLNPETLSLAAWARAERGETELARKYLQGAIELSDPELRTELETQLAALGE